MQEVGSRADYQKMRTSGHFLPTVMERKKRYKKQYHTAQHFGSHYFMVQELPFIIMTKSTRKTTIYNNIKKNLFKCSGLYILNFQEFSFSIRIIHLCGTSCSGELCVCKLY